MTKFTIEADGEVIGETADRGIADAMFDAARDVYAAVTMHEETLS